MISAQLFAGPVAVGYQALPPCTPDWRVAEGARLLAGAASERGWLWAGTYSERGELRGLGAFGLLLAALEREPTLENVLVPSMDHFGTTARAQSRLSELLNDTGVRLIFLDGSALQPDGGVSSDVTAGRFPKRFTVKPEEAGDGRRVTLRSRDRWSGAPWPPPCFPDSLCWKDIR